MLLAAAVVGGIGTFLALRPKRVLHWASFAPTWCIVGTIMTLAIVSAVAFLCIVAAHQTLGTDAFEFHADFVAAAAGVGALRRGSSKDPGAALVLGILPVLFDWVGELVEPHVLRWARGLSDDDLVAAAGRVQDARDQQGRRAPLPTMVDWMTQATRLLARDTVTHAAARSRLEYFVAEAHQTYLMGKS